MSHKHRFKGVELYETMSQIKDLISALRVVKDQEVLEQLENSLTNSLAGLQTTYEALKRGQIILAQLSDLLYGAKDKKGVRPTQDYKDKTDSQKIRQQVEDLLEQAHQKHKKHSTEMRGYLRHFQNTYQNWNTYLFTCYDYPKIPNDNNRLELSHSQMKKQYRRITGQKCTAKYLKIHGEQAAYMLAYSYANNSQEELINLFRQTNPKLMKDQKRQQLLKSQARGLNFATKSRLDKTLQEIKELWVK